LLQHFDFVAQNATELLIHWNRYGNEKQESAQQTPIQQEIHAAINVA
jgi:hypothetical protein